jgi:hypothetical protein
MKFILRYLVFITIFFVNVAVAQNVVIKENIPQAKMVGSHCLKVFGLSIYHIELWSENGKFNYNQPLALSITYHKNFSALQLAKKTTIEMQKVNQLNTEQMQKYQGYINKLFVDVKKNQNKTAIFMPNGVLQIFLEQQKISEVNDLQFAKDFLNIWLSSKSSYPKMSFSLTKS